MSKPFECVKDCSQCCIEREYFPSKEFGKIGVLILPEEKDEIEKLAKKQNVQVEIMPRIATSDSDKPEKILAYQMMGREANGNTCPFLDTSGKNHSPHGGFNCTIYENRPLACKAYPVIESQPLILDSKCKFCQECGSADSNLNKELEAIIKIKEKMKGSKEKIWRYATGIGEVADKDIIKKGWILETQM